MHPSEPPEDSDTDPRTQLFLAIAHLPPSLRRVVRRMLVERESVEQVAEALDLDAEEVRRRLVAGRERLLDELDLEELRRRLR